MSATLFGFNTEAHLCNNILTSSQTCMTIEVFAPSPHIPRHILVLYILDSYESPQLLTSENTCHNRDVFCVLVCLYLQKLFRYMTCNSEKKVALFLIERWGAAEPNLLFFFVCVVRGANFLAIAANVWECPTQTPARKQPIKNVCPGRGIYGMADVRSSSEELLDYR